ncbi:MAG: maltose alpha-D-glucosyltransferase [Chloroflexi bacterium]|nr:MAG: maltose alpha-D-glucosyltransferase [Chloroflexota bacterium]
MADQATWYKDAIIYELHVRAFKDSTGDGVGDFRGLIEKLGYLQELGVTAVWLLPFYPSPLKDDGYDVASYEAVNPSYGSLADLRRFVREAHELGIRVITELVANHTSDQHPWFQRARRAKPGSPWRDYYVWSDSPERYKEARIIFKDVEVSNWTWDPVAKAYYWHRFYSHQPDLNYENPRVMKSILQVLDFWLDMGVDGLRLDAVPYLFEREGTNCENLPETHQALKQMRAHVDARYRDRMLLAEANQWPEDAVTYFGDGDECHMSFHFPLMPRLFMSIQMEDRFPVVDILAQTPAAPENCQWALFLRNHDELTLEMVTDEERDYMYRVYTQDPIARLNLGIRRRLGPLLQNNRRRIELMNGLLFSLPGTPVLYYGDEIGMGDNIYLGDRNGVRTPMQWSADRNAGFSSANRQRLYLPVIVDPEYHYESVNVEAQSANPHSFLSWMKRLIALRKVHPAFGRGTLEFLHPENRRVLAYVRKYEEPGAEEKLEQILVVANLSRFVQYVELDLARFKGQVPVEMFGSTEFPKIGEHSYLLTLGPHAFYWFLLEPARVPAGKVAQRWGAEDLPELFLDGQPDELFQPGSRARLEEILPSYVETRRWFGGKARKLKTMVITDVVPVAARARLLTVEARYAEGDAETYVLVLGFADGDRAGELLAHRRDAVLCRLAGGEEPALLYDALVDPDFAEGLLEAIERRRRFRGEAGAVAANPGRALSRLRAGAPGELEAHLSSAEQSNNSVVFGERLILKLFRRLEPGVNPDLEVSRFLTEQSEFQHIPPFAGSLDYRRAGSPSATLGILQGYVPNLGDAWEYTLGELKEYLSNPHRGVSLEVIGDYLQSAALLGRRTADLHLALASDPDNPDFAPAPSTMLDQRSLFQSVRSQGMQVFELLHARLTRLSDGARADAELVLQMQGELMARLRSVIQRPIAATRIRTHGDYHLGQVLWTGGDFVIIDFEGEPARPIAERRLKRWPLRDVAGMLRSFDYAANEAHRIYHDRQTLDRAARFWRDNVSQAFLREYLATAGGASFLPVTNDERQILLETYLLEKALYEIRYELNSRPDWVRIPLRGILDLMGVVD